MTDRAAGTQLALWARPTPTRLYAARRDRARVRRPTDVVVVAACAAIGIVLVQASSPPSGFERALVDLVGSVPSFFDVTWRVLVGLASLWAVLLVAASVVRARFDIVRDQALAAVASALLATWVGQVASSAPRRGVVAQLRAGGPPADATSLRLAIIAAVCVVASPHLARPFRSTSRWAVASAGLSLVVLGATTPTGALLGVVCGAAAAAVVHLGLGSSGGLLDASEVHRGLAELGIEAHELVDAPRQRAGVQLFDAVGVDGRALRVKVYGRDAWDAQLLAKGWRALWYRDAEALTLTRLQQAEHEGFVTLLAARSGVAVPDVVRAGRTSTNDAILVVAPRGAPLDHGSQLSPAGVGAVWSSVLALGAAGFAHGDLAPSRLRTDGDVIVIDDLAAATAAPSGDQRRVDRAQALVTTAVLAGSEVAVVSALAHLGPEGMAEIVPYLQRAAMGPSLRAELGSDDARLDLDDLRAAAAGAASVDEPKLAKLRRVSAGTLVQAALILAAGYFLISSFAGVDPEQLLDALGEASLPILVVALLLAQTPRLAQAESTRGACPRPIPFGPVVALQFAITFVNLVIPSTAARVAVSIRFFQRQGVPPASAVSIGAIDGFGGFVVQLLILASVTVFDLGHVDLDIDLASKGDVSGLLRVLVLLAAAVVVAVVVVAAVPALRAKVVERVRPWWHEALETLANLRSPAKVARILGGNLVAELLFASALSVVLAAYGVSLPLATLLVINVTVALFAGLMPVPGGIGVSEGALVVGLTAAGVDQAVAFAVAITYRLCTFYLPPIWGGVAFRRLERAGLL